MIFANGRLLPDSQLSQVLEELEEVLLLPPPQADSRIRAQARAAAKIRLLIGYKTPFLGAVDCSVMLYTLALTMDVGERFPHLKNFCRIFSRGPIILCPAAVDKRDWLGRQKFSRVPS